jgi:hypothetical protein
VADVDALRSSLAWTTRRGVGMTFAGGLYWFAMAAVTHWAGFDAGALAIFLCVATVLVYPLGYWLNTLAGGDLLARGHPLGGLVRLLGASQALGWPMLGILCVRDPPLVPFALAALLGAHFVPFGWLYRLPLYGAMGAGSIVVAALLQWLQPATAPVAIPLAMGTAYTVTALRVGTHNNRQRILR